MKRRLPSLLVAAMLVSAASAQDEDQILVDGIPIENAVVGRELALRLRGEVQVTEEDEDIIDEDVRYGRFPTRLYAGEVKVYQADRLSVSMNVDRWDNEQGLDATRLGWSVRKYLTGRTSVTLTYRRRETDYAPTRHDAYAAIGHYLSKDFYAYTRFRYTTQPEEPESYQLSEYLSWSPVERFRLGGELAATHDQDEDLASWYARLFSTCFLVEKKTSLRCEARHYDSRDSLRFQDYKLYLYQRIGGASFLRLGYRFYDDSGGLTSHAYGIRARHFFSPSFAGHVGYRRYDHSEGPDMDTVLAGFQWLL